MSNKNITAYLLILLVLFLPGHRTHAQQTFERIYDLGLNTYGDVIQLEDSSYMMTHVQYIASFREDGMLDWKKAYGDYFSPKTSCYGGDCLYVGARDHWNVFYAKYDLNGEAVWINEIGEIPEMGLYEYKILLTSSNEILYAGEFSKNEKDSVFILKSDTSGVEKWRLNFGLSSNYGSMYDLGIINDRTYGLLYETSLALIDSSGIVHDEINLSQFDPPIKKFKTINDTTFLLLNTETIFKYQQNGSLDTVFRTDSLSFSLLYYETPYIYVLAQGSYGYDSHFVWFYKLDTTGNLSWSQRYGDENEYLSKLLRTSDGGFLLSGLSRTIDITESLVYFAKTDADGNVSPCKDSLFTSREKYILCLGRYTDLESHSIGSHSTAYWTYKGDTVHTGNEPFTFYGYSIGDFTHVLRSCDDSLVVPVRVYDEANTDFTYELTSNGVQYYQEPLDDDWRWEWVMGDGFSMEDSLNPFYQYDINGNYFTKLQIWSPCRSDCTKRVIYHLHIEEKEFVQASVFPNPTRGPLNIFLPISDTYTFKVYNSQGILVWSEDNKPGSRFTFDLHALPPAIYYLQISSPKGKDHFKFVKSCR